MVVHELKSFHCNSKKQLKIQSYIVEDKIKVNSKNTKEQQELLEMIQNNKELREIKAKFPLVNWVFYHNSIYDLTKFFHPGGEFLIEQCKGRDVSRFLVGAYAIETSKLKPHKHSEKAFSLLEKFKIGELNE